MGLEIPIHSLPLELTADEAVEAAYGEEIDTLRDKLLQGLSVLVECDKQLTLYLYRALRARFRAAATRDRRRLQLISGHATAGDGDGAASTLSLLQRLLAQLQEAAFSGDAELVIALPHLDLLTTTTRSGLSAETREAAVLLYENPDAVFLAFKDPSFELPKVIENLFPVRRPLLGIPRERLPQLVTRREARKLAADSLDPYALYKYLSGTHAVRCRQILSHFTDHVDYDPAAPESAAEIYREIRRMTVVADVELPRVDLDRDVGGYGAVKKKIREEILDLLLAKEKSRDPAEIRHIEAIVPKGMIFHGPPGTGKTFFAKAIATALDATILIVSGPELKSRWVGESEANLRRLFTQARRAAPSIIVFDELDSFAAARGTYTGSGVEHSMVNQLLTEMDGFRSEELVFVVGTTNFMEAVDPALLRPGRFELAIEIPYPRQEDRRAIAGIYLGKFGLEAEPEAVDHLLRRTGGLVPRESPADGLDDALPRGGQRFTGDHIYALARALKREELRRGQGRMKITREDVDRAIGGQPDPVRLQAEEEKTIAVHEAGHAVLAHVLPHCPAVEKVTIAGGEGEPLGYVRRAMRRNRYVVTEAELLDDMCMLLGGRTAERLCLRAVSMGASDDLQRASHTARMMVEQLGLSDVVGPRSWTPPGYEEAPHRVSEKTSAAIDGEIDRILKEQSCRAEEVLTRYREQLEALSGLLLEKKTLGLAEIAAVLGDVDIAPPVGPVGGKLP